MGKDIYVGFKAGTTSTINQDGGTVMMTRDLYLGTSGLGTGVYNLNAGTLKLSADTSLNKAHWDSYEFNFNGGAKIDVVNATVTNTFNGALLEDAASLGGGLQKLGRVPRSASGSAARSPLRPSTMSRSPTKTSSWPSGETKTPRIARCKMRCRTRPKQVV